VGIPGRGGLAPGRGAAAAGGRGIIGLEGFAPSSGRSGARAVGGAGAGRGGAELIAGAGAGVLVPGGPDADSARIWMISPHLRHFIRTVLPATFSSAIWYLAAQLWQLKRMRHRGHRLAKAAARVQSTQLPERRQAKSPETPSAMPCRTAVLIQELGLTARP
jgi:hypothetical protein